MLSYPAELKYLEAVDQTGQDFPITKLKYKGFAANNGGGTAVWIQIFFLPKSQVTLGTTKPDDRQLVPASGAARFLMEASHLVTPVGLSVYVTATETGNGAPAAPINVGIYYEGV